MKHILLLLACSISFTTACAQIVLEHTYPDAGYFHNLNERGQMFLWDFESSGMKYVKIDRAVREVTLYHLDHTFYKTFSFANAPNGTFGYPILMYISEHLFDLDDGIEYMYISSGGNPTASYMRVYDEDGTVILELDLGAIMVLTTTHQQQYPIHNTPLGTKLIVSWSADQSARVYGLPGTLSVGVTTATEELIQQLPRELMHFPVPADQGVEVLYELPANVGTGELVFYDLSGHVVSTISLDNSANSIHVDTSSLPAGTYLYQLRAATQVIGGPRLVVVH